MRKHHINWTIVFIYILAGAVLWFADFAFFPDFYEPKLMGGLAFVSAILIVLPRLVFIPRTERQSHDLGELQFVIAVSLLLNGIGGLGLYKLHVLGMPYDKLAHFVTSLLFTVGIAYFLRDWFGKRFASSLLISAVVVTLGGAVWEFLEAFSDSTFGTTLLGGGTGGARVDTIIDVISNTLGVGLGLAFVSLRRRIAKDW